MRNLSPLLFALSLVAINACTKDKTTEPDAVVCTAVIDSTNTYSTRIEILMIQHCSPGCHDAGVANAGVRLHDYTSTKTAFQSQNALCSIKHGSGCEAMPSGSPKLADSLITYIQCWAQNGYAQ